MEESPEIKLIEMKLFCPECQFQHLDVNEWKTKFHKTHLCLKCGHEWRPFEYPTVGVLKLNHETCQHDFEFKPDYSNKDVNGSRRYKCKLCEVWAWRQGNRATDKKEYTIYAGPVYDPLEEWDCRKNDIWNKPIKGHKPDQTEWDEPATKVKGWYQ